MKQRWILKGLKMIFIFVLIAAAMSYLVMSLWNWLMPVVFSLGTITFWQALGILALAKLLFGFGRGSWRGGYGGHSKHRSPQYKEQMEEKLKNMTPEEREKFRAEWRKRCGWRYPQQEDKVDSETPAN
jgi:cell division protein FtsB